MLQRIGDIRKPLRVWPRQLALKLVVGHIFQSQRLDRFQRAQAFEERFLQPMEMDLRAAGTAMDQMADLINETKRNCE